MTDVAAVYAHHVKTSRASFELEPPSAAEMVRRRADVLARGLPWLVAELDGKIAGRAAASGAIACAPSGCTTKGARPATR